MQLKLSGNLKQLKHEGKIQLKIGQLNLDAFDSAFENIGGEIQFKEDHLHLNQISAELGGGRVSLGGEIRLYPEKNPLIQLQAVLKESKVKMYPFQFLKLIHST